MRHRISLLLLPWQKEKHHKILIQHEFILSYSLGGQKFKSACKWCRICFWSSFLESWRIVSRFFRDPVVTHHPQTLPLCMSSTSNPLAMGQVLLALLLSVSLSIVMLIQKKMKYLCVGRMSFLFPRVGFMLGVKIPDVHSHNRTFTESVVSRLSQWSPGSYFLNSKDKCMDHKKWFLERNILFLAT